jgi:excisionase family DNA binding protein
MRKRQQVAPQSNPVPPEHLQLLIIPQVARLLNIGRTKVYGLIKTEGLPTVKLGSTTRVSATSLQRWIAQREHAS